MAEKLLTEKTPIENVIFDFGNVLVIWDPAAALVSRYSQRTIDKFLDRETGGFWEVNDMADRGVSPQEQLSFIRQGWGDEAADIMQWYQGHFIDSITGDVTGSRQLIEDLKAAGIHVWGLSNWAKEYFPTIYKDSAILHMMEDYVVSGFVGCEKPDPEIYQIALKQFGITAESSVFLDDRLNNVEGARNVGIRAIQVTDPYQMRAALIEAGIDIPAVK
jgi:putative hydrolase of the HAD superfamily